MYTFSVDDAIANIVKEAAQKENRTARGQFRHFLLKALEDSGYLTLTNKKADPIRQDNQSAYCHHSE